MARLGNVDLWHFHENKGLYILTVTVERYTGFFFSRKRWYKENYVSINGESWVRMPDKVAAEEPINSRLRQIFEYEKSLDLLDDLRNDR